ncbi:hypothetical protein BDC45DRAFT_528352 [Circinella umbellata]|nr:hypothetical protein BDC45DRAFT_528352 [Circinella umbellata]
MNLKFKSSCDTVFKVLIDGSKQDYIAAVQALETKADNETILAALLHDIGKLEPTNSTTTSPNSTISVGVTGHERIGAEYLRKLGFSNKVAQLVESHVPVKRYLTGKDHSYYESLSGASGGLEVPDLESYRQMAVGHLMKQDKVATALA